MAHAHKAINLRTHHAKLLARSLRHGATFVAGYFTALAFWTNNQRFIEQLYYYYYYALCIELLVANYRLFTISATSIISPPETALVCIGEQLEITCNVTGSFLKWSINLFLSTGDESYSRILSTFSETTYLQTNHTQFTFSRVSPQSSLPLESVVLVSPARDYLNGTVVTCTDTATGISSSTTIKIITDLGKSTIEAEIIMLFFCNFNYIMPSFLTSNPR
jgi:hypothetical protein